jgi:MFS transporter, YNFM family, putative membrane transport protein
VTGLLIAVGGTFLLYALASQYNYLLKRSKAQVVLGTVFLEGLFVFGGLAYLASSLTDRFGMTTVGAGIVLAGFGIGGLAYSFSVKKLVARIGELGILLLGGGLMSFAFVSIGLMSNWQSFVPLVIVLGTGFYTMHGTLQTNATEIAPEARGAAISLFAFFFFLGQSVGPIALGRVLELHGYSAAFVTAGLGLLLVAIGGRTLFARVRRLS